MVWGVVPTIVHQGAEFIGEVQRMTPTATKQVTTALESWRQTLKQKYDFDLLQFASVLPEKPPTETTLPVPAGEVDKKPAATVPELETLDIHDLLSGAWIKNTLASVGPMLWNFVKQGVGGFLGVFGFVLSMVIVPLYLYYFLTESAHIKDRWADYVPLRASRFKDEVVGTLNAINGYLMAFFRGQLVVSSINGLLTGLGLVTLGLKFGWLIGLALCVLGMIPYLGIFVCWIPAVIIACVQGQEGTWLVGPGHWWLLPLLVTACFALVQQIDGLFITPKIVGESVGLHPMTVIVSVFAWTLMLGGLLGAILAVPLTASIKVLFERYVWRARIMAEEPPPAEGI
jgi:predicted PurR-regulated permease PerM